MDSPIGFSVFKKSFLQELGFKTCSDKCVTFFSKVTWSYKDESYDDIFLILTDGENFSILDEVPDSLLWPDEIPCKISDDFSLERFFEGLNSVSKDIEQKKEGVFSEIIQLEDFRFDSLKNRISDGS